MTISFRRYLNSRLIVILLCCAVAIAIFIAIGKANGLDSGEWASWVQAVGSIAAIFFAYLVGERQGSVALQTVREAARISSARAYDQILALADSAEKFTESMSQIFHNGGFDFLEYKLKYDDAITESLLDSLKAVPAHELGSYNAILALATLRKALSDFRSNMTRIQTYLAGQRNEETGAIANWHDWNAVPVELCVENMKRCSAALRKYRPDFAKHSAAD